MARPQKNTIDYFPHPVQHGRKMFYLRSKFNNDGYAVWFMLLEHLGKAEYHYLDLSDKVQLMYLSSEFMVSEIVLKEIINILVDFDEFDKELWQNNMILFNQKFIENINDAYKKRNNECISRKSLLSLLSSKGVLKSNKSSNLPNKCTTKGGSNTQTILEETILEETKEKSIINNTSVEQSSTYELILKNSKDISAYIEKEKPKILKPYTDLWNLFATKYGKPKVSETKSRQDKLKVRLKENKFEFVKILINVSKSSDFNLKSKWLNFDWILKSEANYIKILEGNYMQSDFEKAQDEQKQVKQQIETISINSRDN
jgi:hypothetical protein